MGQSSGVWLAFSSQIKYEPPKGPLHEFFRRKKTVGYMVGFEGNGEPGDEWRLNYQIAGYPVGSEISTTFSAGSACAMLHAIAQTMLRSPDPEIRAKVIGILDELMESASKVH